MKRLISNSIIEDLEKKIVIITGPRQCGKTYLSKELKSEWTYLNYDLAEHRFIIQEKSWSRDKGLVIFDEIHKMNKWKSWLKGVYDVEGIPPEILVTGSAKLNVFKKAGDSLAGRHFTYRLHPFDLKEVCLNTDISPEDAFNRLMSVGGFAEPFLDGSERFYKRWKGTHIDLILREDLIDYSSVRDIKGVETLIELLRTRVGSPVSANSLSQDLQKSPKTVLSWLELLEELYVIFRTTPYHKNIARSLLKEPKFYFYDCAMPIGDQGMKLENLVACALLKEIHYRKDTSGEDYQLHYLRKKEGHEIDFIILKDKKPHYLIEVKWKDDILSKNFKKFNFEGNVEKVQVVGKLPMEKSYPTGEKIIKAINFLKTLSF